MNVLSLEALHFKAAESYGVAVSGKADEAGAAVQTFGGILDLTAIQFVEVHIQDFGAIQRHLDVLTTYLDLLEIPLTHGAQVAVFSPHAVVKAAMILIWLQALFTCCCLPSIVAIAIDDLQFQAI